MTSPPKKSDQKRLSRVTLKDISQASGLAISTVSNALSGGGTVREETRKRLLKVADELGYRTSSLARSLRTGKTGSIGMLVADIASPYYAEVIRGAEDYLLERDYILLVGNTDHDATRELNYVNHFIDRHVEGIILAPHSMYSKSLDLIDSHGPPVCLFNRNHEKMTYDIVGADFQAATRAALEHLWSLGHRNIAFTMGSLTSSVNMERLATVRFFLSEKGAPEDSVIVRHSRYSVEVGQELARELMRSRPNLTAIMTAQDTVAIGVIIALQEMGLRVPEDVSVIGFDDIFPAALPQIRLTTLKVPQRLLGRLAAETVLQRIENPRAYIKNIRITPELAIRGSTGPAPAK